MTQEVSGIGGRRKEEKPLAQCIAARQAFDNSMGLTVSQMAVTPALPVVGAIAALFCPAGEFA